MAGQQATVKYAPLASMVLSLCFASSAAAAGQAVEGTSLAPLIGEAASINAAFTAAHGRTMLEASIIPAEVNRTATGVKNTFKNATTAVTNGFNKTTTAVSNHFNKTSTEFTQLGQTSALDTAAKSKNASVGDYANAFVNDTNRALGAIGSVFKSSSEQSTLSQASMIAVAVMALMLGIMG